MISLGGWQDGWARFQTRNHNNPWSDLISSISLQIIEDKRAAVILRELSIKVHIATQIFSRDARRRCPWKCGRAHLPLCSTFVVTPEISAKLMNYLLHRHTCSAARSLLCSTFLAVDRLTSAWKCKSWNLKSIIHTFMRCEWRLIPPRWAIFRQTAFASFEFLLSPSGHSHDMLSCRLPSLLCSLQKKQQHKIRDSCTWEDRFRVSPLAKLWLKCCWGWMSHTAWRLLQGGKGWNPKRNWWNPSSPASRINITPGARIIFLSA